MANARHALQSEFEAELAAELDRLGVTGFDKKPLVRAYVARGVPRQTLYRWIDAVIKSGKPQQAMARKVKAKAKERAARTEDPAAEVAAEVADILPAVVTMDDVTSQGPIAAIDHLQVCIRAAEDVLRFARNPDGSVRAAKMMLAASDHLRRTLDTAARITEVMYQGANIDRFHKAVMATISQASPELAEKLLVELDRLAMQFGG